MGRMMAYFFLGLLLNSFKAASQLHLSKPADSSLKKLTIQGLPQNFYNKQLSFFCKKEIQLQRISGLPVFIRLGSKDHVDYLERKPNSFMRKKNE